MSEEFYTVEFAAERLKLHPKTVLKFIRDGRLRATRIGRQYRILGSDLAALVGDSRPAGGLLRQVRSTTIVDISNVDAELARRMASLMTGARSANGRYAEPFNVDVVHDPANEHLKIIVVARPSDAVQLLQLVEILLESRT
ncbi:DNA-binding protein [Phyllobacterium salinisoli]|uniref:DNA-binding protein n=1 Tax=Phyllobacterium salinisoli TaxID=1899321 RepID=A0A368K8M6_9HYPH|nr:helix-turn-helix domain-containing protein [Phyllobacterium salinisoli]RCS25699.1 DNA-binding protein [Phyllobacterium salinisoli]